MKKWICFGFCLGINIISGLSLLFWLPAVGAVGMGFDSQPATVEATVLYIVLFNVLIYPIVFLVSLGCWSAYHKEKFTLAYFLASITVFWIILIILFILIFATVNSMFK
ncbi:hypothetical protein NLX71_24510 [Paenibacillus sp. MZ04-78.2]|uniref:hypothetical protein n=1 Tax=Paenibacillus sp. MZ04-78.2 TaxID=2962034 RepID=UPI0020B6FA0B|nr:hypothetical protein [Paenibacillus sp. MZ04-78.2]MCP3776412.1 hypothetical protein [Paenibacillus sp. MZ04-78.2]